MTEYCNCYVKTNIKCAKCNLSFRNPETKLDQINELMKRIKSNVQDNIIYRMEIQELQNELQDEIEYEEEKNNNIIDLSNVQFNYNCLSDPNCLISCPSPLSDDLYTTKSADLSSSSSSSDSSDSNDDSDSE